MIPEFSSLRECLKFLNEQLEAGIIPRPGTNDNKVHIILDKEVLNKLKEWIE